MRAADFAQVPKDMKKGLTLLIDGMPSEILECITQKSQSVKLKFKSLQTGAVAFKTLKSGARLEQIGTLSTPATYSYFDDTSDEHVLMDNDSFEEIRISADVIGDRGTWLTEGTQIDLQLYNNKVVSLGLPPSVTAEVVAVIMNPGSLGVNRIKAQKVVRLSNGLTKPGPAYLKVGDRVLIDSKSGDILKRL